jgi:hypothetical protein
MLAVATLGGRAFAFAAALFAAASVAAAPPAGTGSAQPKAAAERPKAYNIGGALALGENAGYQFQTVTGPVRLDIPTVLNESTTNTSGTVRVALFVTAGPSATQGTYWTIAFADLGTLSPGFRFNPSSQTVSYSAPPDGTYYVHMGVFEFEPTTCAAASGYCLDDFVTFTDRVQVINGQIFDAGPPPEPQALAVEFFHAGFNHYFVTSYTNEIQALDTGVIVGWTRTGRSFPVWSQDTGGKAGVCRFFSTSFAPRSSHFYTPYADECTTLRGNPNWQFEAVAFFVENPDVNGSCAVGRRPLYRLYNQGLSGAPNHRYTTELDVRQAMLNAGWISEGWGPLGAIACVPA